MLRQHGVRLAEVDYIPAYPIAPQTEIIETPVRWIYDGIVDVDFQLIECNQIV